VLHNIYFWQKKDAYLRHLRRNSIKHFVAVSDYVKEYSVNHLGIDPVNVSVICNGLDRTGLIRPPEKVRLDRRLGSCKYFKIAHVANFQEAKRHPMIIAAFRRVADVFPDSTLYLIGDDQSNQELIAHVKTCIADARLQKNVILTGHLDRRQLSDILSDAHLGILASSFEGFSIATLEYTYFGLPCVLSDTGAAKYLINQYGNGLVFKSSVRSEDLSWAGIKRCCWEQYDSDAAELAHTINEILADYKPWAVRGALAGRKYNQYSIERTATAYCDLIRSQH
jgi:glycosyltransferase involved in cell wall biosynthesis